MFSFKDLISPAPSYHKGLGRPLHRRDRIKDLNQDKILTLKHKIKCVRRYFLSKEDQIVSPPPVTEIITGCRNTVLLLYLTLNSTSITWIRQTSQIRDHGVFLT